jgi:hypothetical protein
MTDVIVETKDTKKFDPEAFAMNIAKAMENSGRALAAYLKPRESGELKKCGRRSSPRRATSVSRTPSGNQTSFSIS